MEKAIKKSDLKISLIFALIGLIASVFIAIYQISIITIEMKEQILLQLNSVEMLIVIAAFQGAILTFVASFIGLKLARAVNLKLNFKFDKRALIMSILIAFLVALVITGSDRFIFAKYLPDNVTKYVFSPIYLISGILYGGVVEEILLRLLIMSFIVFVLWKLFAKDKDSLNIPDWAYIVAITLSAILFAAGHLPITLQTIGNSTPILIRAFLLNGIGGVGFGYLYWKKGLSYSIAAHALSHVFMQIIFMPILF